MIAYHGTDRTSANNIVGPPSGIDVTRGGGELGRGFYLGENISLAKAIAVGKHGQENAAVIRFDTDDSAFIRLQVKNLHSRQYVYQTWKNLKKKRICDTYLFNTDVICAPFATIAFSYQYKFESENSQDVLNNNATKEIL
jgi:hypothetical protein